ncbi:hypothetical protein [Phage DSL-LC06]|nr:hypothetical protein [Phage DSL-LC06]
MKKLLIAALLVSTSAFAEDNLEKKDISFFQGLTMVIEGLGNDPNRFIATHGEQYRIKDGKVYNSTARKYLESIDYYRRDAR